MWVCIKIGRPPSSTPSWEEGHRPVLSMKHENCISEDGLARLLGVRQTQSPVVCHKKKKRKSVDGEEQRSRDNLDCFSVMGVVSLCGNMATDP